MRIISVNVNGIRSAWSKGFWPWLVRQRADVVCIQEVKAQEPDLEGAAFQLKGYERHLFCAEKKGYSGVGLYCRRTPDRVIEGLGVPEFDCEGRYVQADFGRLSLTCDGRPTRRLIL